MIVAVMIGASLIGAQGVTLDLNFAAIGTLLVAAAGAYSSAKLLNVNRRRIIAEASDAATESLERALSRYEKDNERLHSELDRCRRQLFTLEEADRLREERIVELEHERGQLLSRIAQLEDRLHKAGINGEDF